MEISVKTPQKTENITTINSLYFLISLNYESFHNLASSPSVVLPFPSFSWYSHLHIHTCTYVFIHIYVCIHIYIYNIYRYKYTCVKCIMYLHICLCHNYSNTFLHFEWNYYAQKSLIGSPNFCFGLLLHFSNLMFSHEPLHWIYPSTWNILLLTHYMAR